MLRVYFSLMTVAFTMSAPSVRADYIIASKEMALNKFKARSQTFNVSYPGGDTTVPSTTAPQTCTCPPLTTAPETTCPPTANVLETTCTPVPDQSNLIYILPPVLTVVGFAAGIFVGAFCMKRHGITP